MKIPKILITGSTGFLGRALVRQCLSLPVSLVLPVRQEPDPRNAATAKSESYFVVGDIFNQTAKHLAGFMSEIDVVIHAAWCTKRQDYLNSIENLKAADGSVKLAQAAMNAGVGRFVGIGTAFEYGNQESPLRSDAPVWPTNLYAASKVATFYLQKQLLEMGGVEFAWVRLFNLYGEGEHPDRLFPYIRNQLAKGKKGLLGSPERVRDYMDVDAAAAQIIDIALGDQIGSLNVCAGLGLSIRQIAEKIAAEYGRQDLLEFGSVTSTGFEPEVSVGVPSLGENTPSLSSTPFRE